MNISGAGPVLGIDVRPADGMLYGVTSDGNIVTIDVASGKATMKSKLSEAWTRSAAVTFDFNPAADRLRLMSAEGVSWRINVDDGKVTVDGSHKYKDAMAGKTPRVVAGAYTNSFKDTKATALYNIDAATSSLVTQAPPNDGVLNTVGPLGITVNGPVAFNIVSSGPGPERSLARDGRRALLGRPQDRQGDHGRQDRRPQRHAQRYRLDELIQSPGGAWARPVATRGGLSPLTGHRIPGMIPAQE